MGKEVYKRSPHMPTISLKYSEDGQIVVSHFTTALLLPAFFLLVASLWTRNKIAAFAGGALFIIWFGMVVAQVLGVWISHP